MVCISNVNNKYEIAKETTFGVLPDPFTQLDLGQIQTINISEEENMEKLTSINGGHTANLFEDGLYFANVSIDGNCTKASLPTILESAMGGYSSDGTDYTVVSSTDYKSYSLRVNWETTQRLVIRGLTVKDFTFDVAKDGSVSYSLNCLAQIVVKEAGTVTATANTDKIFKDLDTSVTIGGNSFVLNSFSLSGNWNVTDNEGRGIEAVSATERRLLKCFVKHTFDVSGSYEAEVDTDLEMGYADERTDEAIVVTFSRGADNVHVFTMANTRSGGRTLDLSTDNSKKVISYDFEALDVGMTGDL